MTELRIHKTRKNKRIDSMEPTFKTIINQWEPQEDSVLYYYCSANSFMSIVKNKTLRFCDLYHMNDLSELQQGKLIYDQIIEKSIEFSDDTKKKIDTVLKEFINRCILLSMSFSHKKDLLSQWRGYADDAKGFCLGFKAKYFTDLPIHLLEVEYDFEKQFTLIMDSMRQIESHIQNGIDKENLHLICELQEVFSMIKNESFKEESECRLIYPIFVDVDGEGKLYDAFKGNEKYHKYVRDIEFRLVGNTPTPYVDMDFTLGNSSMPLKEVIIGPKNRSTKLDIELFLRTNGIQGAKISESLSTYR